MRASKLLHKIIQLEMDNRRLNCLIDVVETALSSKSLSVTQLGYHLKNNSQARSNIRKVDRLYSNHHLQQATEELYKDMAHYMITTEKPVICIDGTKVLNTEFYSLRATLHAQGRGLTVYELLYTQAEYGSQDLYQRFLSNLSQVLPINCQPILVTDAEFKGPWFNLVLSYGWDFVGRLRGDRYCCLSGNDEFYRVDGAKVRATKKPRYLGPGKINKAKSVAGNFYVYKKPSKGRHAYTRSGHHSETKKSLNNARSANESWFLFSSLKTAPKKIIQIYSMRMSIEENFRDTKSERYGLSLNMTRTKQINRCKVMLLIAALASLIAYLIGCAGEMKTLQRQFQANSTRKRRVLSRFFLGCLLLHRCTSFLIRDINHAKQRINEEASANV